MGKLFLTTDRLTIRNLKSEDLELFYQYRSNPKVTKYQGFDVMNEEDAKLFIANQTDKTFGKPGEWVQYGIEDMSTNNLIGDCAIKLDGNDARMCNAARQAPAGIRLVD